MQLVVEIVGELLFGVAYESLAGKRGEPRPKASPIVAVFGYALLGGLVGAFSVLPFPHRLSHDDAVSIFGVFANALVFGAIMHAYGQRRGRAGKTNTTLATFWGGAAFAFAISAARLAVIVVS